MGQDLRFSVPRVEVIRNFCNKIWNIARFVMLSLEGSEFKVQGSRFKVEDLRAEDRWILSRLQRTIDAVNSGLESYDMDKAARAIYDFLWSEYADWYIEIAKPRLQGEDRAVVQYVLWHVLETSMRLLHPIMPFITEQIWQSIPHEGESIMVAEFPKSDADLISEDAERRMEAVMEITRAIRNLRAEVGIAPGKPVECVVVPSSAESRAAVEAGSEIIKSLARIGEFVLASAAPTGEKHASAHLPIGDVYVPLAGLVDVDREIARLTNELAEVERDLARSQAKLSNEQFMSRAPAHVVEKEQRIVQELTDKHAKLKDRLAMLGS
jgi:valyl-tRNA synthetase